MKHRVCECKILNLAAVNKEIYEKYLTETELESFFAQLTCLR